MYTDVRELLGLTFVPNIKVAPHPLARAGSIAICTVSTMHIVQASLLLHNTSTGNATSVDALIWGVRAIGHSMHCTRISSESIAIIMICSAIIALMASTLRLGWVRLTLFLPQHCILGIMTIGGLWAAYLGSYLDHTAKPWEHILADQITLLALFVIHTSAILRRARDPNG